MFLARIPCMVLSEGSALHLTFLMDVGGTEGNCRMRTLHNRFCPKHVHPPPRDREEEGKGLNSRRGTHDAIPVQVIIWRQITPRIIKHGKYVSLSGNRAKCWLDRQTNIGFISAEAQNAWNHNPSSFRLFSHSTTSNWASPPSSRATCSAIQHTF